MLRASCALRTFLTFRCCMVGWKTIGWFREFRQKLHRRRSSTQFFTSWWGPWMLKEPLPALSFLFPYNRQQWFKKCLDWIVIVSRNIVLSFHCAATLDYSTEIFGMSQNTLPSRKHEVVVFVVCPIEIGLLYGYVLFDHQTGRIRNDVFGGRYDCSRSNDYQALLSETPLHWWYLFTACGLISLRCRGRDFYFISVNAPTWRICQWNSIAWTFIEW